MQKFSDLHDIIGKLGKIIKKPVFILEKTRTFL
jgi:hypothetical protein